MPGDHLTCIWQAVHAKTEDDSISDFQESVKSLISSEFSPLESAKFSETKYDEYFSREKFTFESMKKYINEELREQNVPEIQLYNDIEMSCWNVCSNAYKSQLVDYELMKLWQIANRLMLEDTYPPVISKDDGFWFFDKFLTTLGSKLKVHDLYFSESETTFQQFIEDIEKHIVVNSDREEFSKCIDKIYSWFVEEVVTTGWMYKRTRKQANWTNWSRQWFELTPGKLQYYTSATGDVSKDKKYKGEIIINGQCDVGQLPDGAGIAQCYPNRFKISNFPVFECELSAETGDIKKTWSTSLTEMIECCRDGTTPMQRMLKSRHDIEEKLMTSFLKISPIGINVDSRATKEKHYSQTKKDLKSKNSNDSLAVSQNLMKQEKEKIKGVFMKIDTDGNGVLNNEEFSKFLHDLGLDMTEKEANLVFNNVDTDGNGTINFDEFAAYFSKHILDESGGSDQSGSSALRKAFLQADRDGTGTLDFKEFTEYVWAKNRSSRMSELLTAFQQIGTSENELNFDMFKDICEKSEIDFQSLMTEDGNDSDDPFDAFDKQLKQSFDNTDTEDLALYIRDRWKSFDTFRRVGASGEVVMKGSEGMVDDFMPGEYNLIDLVCFSDLPPLEPNHTVIPNVIWQSSNVSGKSGKLILPADFNGKIATDFATGELLRYYSCSFADAKQEKVSLLYRHGIQDFTYENQYLSEYVKKTNGGGGIEKHDFSHLDCPLDNESGYFILGKLNGNDLHVTAFHVPTRHTLYVPGGTIHSNDYLKGTWRTMLSDEAEIDHVHLTKTVKNNGNETLEHITFDFS